MMKIKPPVTGGNQGKETESLVGVLWQKRESQAWTLRTAPTQHLENACSLLGGVEGKKTALGPKLLYYQYHSQ